MAGKYNPEKHNRRSIRLKGYDYAQCGAYFITICTQDRQCLLGEIQNGEMHLNEIGYMVQNAWNELPAKYTGIDIDESIIMPNHMHGIIILPAPVGAGPRACPEYKQPRPNSNARNNADYIPTQTGHPQGGAPTLPDIVHRYKSFTTSEYRTNVVKLNWPPFPGRLWQRNYYERIIRNDSEINRIRLYIINNPLRWDDDENNPANL